jgi:hypothetical protein|tara:strand:- start:300 stop:563 length:264 start_codon:yes stop_codon:yes gene_type:complete
MSGVSPNSIFGLLKSNLYTIVVPLVLAAFVWMAVGVLDNECKKSSKSDTVKLTKQGHIAVGIIATLYAAINILKLHPAGRKMVSRLM